MVTVDHGAAQLGADPVELIAEFRHFVRAVFVAGDDLVDRVEYHGREAPFPAAADQPGRELIQRHDAAAQIPDRDIVDVFAFPAQRGVYVLKAVLAAGRIKLQIDVEHTALRAMKAQPLPPLGNGGAQLDQRKGFARLARAGEQQLVSLPQHALDQRRRKRRHIVPDLGERLHIGQVVVGRFNPFLPLGKRRLADVFGDDILPVFAAQYARHTAQARGIAVLAVQLQAVLFAHAVEIVHALAVFAVVARLDAHDGVQALPARMHQHDGGQLQLADQRVLLANAHAVRFDQRIAEVGHIFVLHALSVQRIEADPRPCLALVVADDRADVARAARERLDQLAGRAVIAPFCGQVSVSVLVVPCLGHIADVLAAFKEQLQIALQLLCRLPFRIERRNLALFDPVRVHDRAFLARADHAVPVQRLAGIGAPAVVHGQLDERAARHARAGKARPFSGALAAVIARRIAPAPVLPDREVVPLRLERHADAQPFGIVQRGGIERAERLLDVVASALVHAAPPSFGT